MTNVHRLVAARRYSSDGSGKAIRVAARLSLPDIAGTVGVHVSTIFRWEDGTRSPHGDAAARWADLLDELLASARSNQ